MLLAITPLVLTYNEEPNIGRCLEKLSWAAEVVVVDSYSVDRTLEIASSFSNVRILQRTFDTFASQWNFGLGHTPTEWILSLDADYVLSDQVVAELGGLDAPPEVAGYDAVFQYCIAGRALRGSLYPPRIVLFRKSLGSYFDDGHTQRLALEGTVCRLAGLIRHDDRKPLSRWIVSQDRYSREEAAKLLRVSRGELRATDRIRRTKVIAPVLVLLYCLIVRRGIVDGWPGVYYALQRLIAECLLSIRLIELGWKTDE